MGKGSIFVWAKCTSRSLGPRLGGKAPKRAHFDPGLPNVISWVRLQLN